MSKEFKVGDKVRVLVDAPRGQFLKGCIYEVHSVYEENGKSRIMVVADSNGNTNGWLADYFELVESFDDLIDVVVKAYKNRLLDIFLMNDEVITVFNYDATGTKEGINRSDTSKYYQFINFINSLYTETFVIDSVEDMSKMKKGAKGSLPNGLESTVTDEASEMFSCENSTAITVNFSGMEHNELLYLSPLKGATITQKIENNSMRIITSRS